MGRLTGRPAALIVDDSQFICKILAKSLLDFGFRLIAIGGSCEEALAHVQTFPPDLITLDLVLPDGDGFELFEKLRELRPAAQVIIVSDVRRVEQFEKATKMGAVGFIGKPFQEAHLRQVLQKLDLAAGTPVGP
ncbi:MAG: response regulator [Candidatus Riflebacteria bacterium]|nr:response regulator [Candidatus Riflebacteria bacterium]